MQLNYILFCQLPCCLRSIPISSHFPRSPLFHVINSEFCTSVQHCLFKFVIYLFSIDDGTSIFHNISFAAITVFCLLSSVSLLWDAILIVCSHSMHRHHVSAFFSALFRYISEPSQDMVAVRFGFANGRFITAVYKTIIPSYLSLSNTL